MSGDSSIKDTWAMAKRLVGPSLLTLGFGSLCVMGVSGVTTAISTAFFIYVTGIVPENEYFPSIWFRNNIFGGLYSIYCSNEFGYTYLRTTLHKRQRIPHSDYRHGVRCISGGHVTSSPFPDELQTNSEFYERGGGIVSLKGLGEEHQECFGGVVIVPVPILADNYAYFILSFSRKRCAVVDPADPELVLYMLTVVRHLTKVNFVLTDILTTHKHWDHAGGNLELLNYARGGDSRYTELLDANLKVYGSASDKPHACTNLVEEGDVLTIADGGAAVSVLSSPGHTAGSVLFLVGDTDLEGEGPKKLALFTGDCIFSAGCGAMFELTSVDEVMQTFDLFHGDKTRTHPVTKQTLLPDDVLLYVGHEYTERLLDELYKMHVKGPGSNEIGTEMSTYRKELRLAMGVTRQLRFTRAKDDITSLVRLDEKSSDPWKLPACTVPSTLTIERKINPLLTIKRSVLEQLRVDSCSPNKLMSTIYGSVERHIVG
ncbi:putative hydroxyacylglutathione hydrolase [Trypanosoma grayi]|uniref:putative hydroxyacylglutathione hydrolase n=1 Tax=Trypanosoma grayi TaxID=71804 RepID=UPI0004F48811|nr:putative hydroxyacylglutathione hydrolase [Trypanosoma grayi]KEG15322.1 putative hydroxyacylglutathione hydrolase [Trypanosoma grayi]